MWAVPYRWGSMVISYKKSKFQQYKLAPIQVCVVGLLISIQEEVNITEHVSGFRTGRICGDLSLQEGSQWGGGSCTRWGSPDPTRFLSKKKFTCISEMIYAIKPNKLIEYQCSEQPYCPKTELVQISLLAIKISSPLTDESLYR
ncbi:hypothetical protein YC2023_100881 [Brassica napus]